MFPRLEASCYVSPGLLSPLPCPSAVICLIDKSLFILTVYNTTLRVVVTKLKRSLCGENKKARTTCSDLPHISIYLFIWLFPLGSSQTCCGLSSAATAQTQMERGADGASKNEEFLEVSMSEEKQNGLRRLYNNNNS